MKHFKHAYNIISKITRTITKQDFSYTKIIKKFFHKVNNNKYSISKPESSYIFVCDDKYATLDSFKV